MAVTFTARPPTCSLEANTMRIRLDPVIRPMLLLRLRASSNVPSRRCTYCQGIFRIHDPKFRAPGLMLPRDAPGRTGFVMRTGAVIAPLQHGQRRLSLCNLMVEPSRAPVAKALLTPLGRAFARQDVLDLLAKTYSPRHTRQDILA